MNRVTGRNPCDMTPDLLPLGPDGILLRVSMRTSPDASAEVRSLLARIEAAGLEGVTEVAGALSSVLVRFDPAKVSRKALTARLEDLPAVDSTKESRRIWSVPAAFGGEAGPQLAEACDLAGRSPEEAIADITGTTLDVLTIGFAPGQPYLGHLSEAWDIPRQTGLTPQVPAGAVVVALRQVIPFVNASTTGWRHVGLTAFRAFQRDREEPFALRTGDRLRFVHVTEKDIERLRGEPDGLGGAKVEQD